MYHFAQKRSTECGVYNVCMKKILVRSLEEMDACATEFVARLSPQGTACVVGLSGNLGAGKTAFVKSVAKALGITDHITSPTFVLQKTYPISQISSLTYRQTGSSFHSLVHIDAYRLEKGSDLAALGFDELLQDPGNLIMLEWPENVAEALPAPAVRVMLTALPDGSHTLAYG